MLGIMLSMVDISFHCLKSLNNVMKDIFVNTLGHGENNHFSKINK